MSSNVTVDYVDQDESWEIFEAAAQRLLGVSADAFVAAWDSGEYADRDEVEVMRVAMLRPSGR